MGRPEREDARSAGEIRGLIVVLDGVSNVDLVFSPIHVLDEHLNATSLELSGEPDGMAPEKHLRGELRLFGSYGIGSCGPGRSWRQPGVFPGS